MSNDKRQLALLLRVEDDGDYFRFHAAFMTREDDDLRGMSASSWRNESPEIYDGLTITCQNDSGHAKQGSFSYAWGVAFLQPYNVTLSRAKEFVKVLSFVERKQQELNEMAGSSTDFASYMLRVAAIFKIRNFAVVERYGMTWQNSQVLWMTADAARRHVEEAEAAYVKKHQPEVVPQEASA